VFFQNGMNVLRSVRKGEAVKRAEENWK